MRYGVRLGPFWSSFGGRRRRQRARRPAAAARSPAEPQALERQQSERRVDELAERRRVAAMTREEYGRSIGMSADEEDEIAAQAELQWLRHEMGYRDQD